MVDSRENTVGTPQQRGPLVALAFWVCLLISAVSYAVCALSPRIVEWETLKQRHVENQVELVELQGQIKHLERVVDAIQTDPEFTARLARSEFGGVVSSGGRTPLPTAIDYDPRLPRTPARPHVAGLPWYVPLVQRVADDDDLRMRGLGAAGGLMLFAFLFLQERSLGILDWPRRLAARVMSRYVIADDPARGAMQRK